MDMFITIFSHNALVNSIVMILRAIGPSFKFLPKISPHNLSI